MRAMDYIDSADICYLVCDILRLLDKRPIEHGERVAYIMLQLMEAKKDMDEYEIAEFAFLGMIHDLGAYKTEKLNASKEIVYDGGDEDATNRHSVYGGLFVQNVSPFGDRGEVIMYHHWPYNKMRRMSLKYERIASYMRLAEDVDKAFIKDGIKMDLQAFEPKAGQDYIADSIMLLMKCARRNDMLIKLKDGRYKQELRDYIEDNILFTNEEKEGYVRFAMHLYSLREQARSIEAIICSCITDEVAEDMDFINRDKEKLYYAALMRDLGMLSVDLDIINAPRKLTDDEMEEMRDHVAVTEEIMSKYFAVKDVTDIAVSHHENLSGTGYPKKLHESQMKKTQLLLQVADMVTAMLSPRKHRGEMSRAEIVDILHKLAIKNQVSDDVVKSLQNRFDTIEKRIQSETKEYVDLHQRINSQYKLLLESHMGMSM